MNWIWIWILIFIGIVNLKHACIRDKIKRLHKSEQINPELINENWRRSININSDFLIDVEIGGNLSISISSQIIEDIQDFFSSRLYILDEIDLNFELSFCMASCL